MRKASLEGMSEAFGLFAGANDRREAAREEGGRDLMEPGQGGGLATRFVRGLCGPATSPTNAVWEGHPCSFAWVEILAISEVKTFWEEKGAPTEVGAL